MNLPEDYQSKMQQMLGDEYLQYLDSFNHNYGQTLRVNQLKEEPADFIRRFLLNGQVSWCETGFYYEGKQKLSAHPYYYAGVYYLQEPSAMAPAAFLPVEPGDKVLDLCAAPGGKSTALAAKLQGEGFLLSNDISASRCKPLLKNMEMAGVTNAVITCESPEKLAGRFSSYFDKVLVDAPCSGEGMFRREPPMVKSWSLEEVERYAQLQREILTSAAQMVKPGGCLLYSTCTFAKEEDEQTVEYFLEQNPDFSLQELPLCGGIEEGRPEWTVSGREDVKNCRRFLPHKVKGEGHFAALFKKTDSVEDVNKQCIGEKVSSKFVYKEAISQKKVCKGSTHKGKMCKPDGRAQTASKSKIPEVMEEFMRDIADWEQWKQRVFFVKERAFLLPENCPDFKGLRVVRSGLYLGDCLKKRFEPSQALGMALKPEQYKRRISLPAEDIRVEKYLRGETVDIDDAELSGWTLFCVEDFPLGWGKCNRGRLKNKYNPNWRKL